MGTKWNLFPLPVRVRSTINDLQTIRTGIDKKVNDQIAIWKKIQGSSDCLKVHAGIQFQTIQGKDYLFVSDPNKLRNFRLSGNKVKCHSLPFQYSEFTTEHTILGIPIKTDYLGTPVANPEYKNIRNDVHTYKNEELQDNVNLNNSLGDVGLENYCIHHLQKYQLEQKSNQIMDRRTLCEAWKKEGTLLKDQKPRGGCEDFPDGMAKEMKALAAEMDRVSLETGYQPYDTMSTFDKNIYSSFKGNLVNLKKAQEMAEKSMNWSFEAEKYLKDNNLWSTDESLSNCGESNPINDSNFIEGQNQCSTYEPTLNLNSTNFSANFDVVNADHRDNMIKEINGQAFAKTIESAYHLLEYGKQPNQDLRKKLWTEFSSNKINDNSYKTACNSMAPDNLCSDQLYFSHFKKGILNAMTKIKELDERHLKTKELMNNDPNYTGPSPDYFKPPGTFLRYDDKDVAKGINNTFGRMQSICREMRDNASIHGDPEVKAQWLKNYEDQFRYLQNFAGYFYDDHVRNTVNLDKWTATPGKCPDDIKTNLKEILTPEAIGAAKNGFMQASEEQLKSISDFQRDDRGNHSNAIGAFFCGKNGKEKQDLYALSSLLTSHPFIAGQMVSAMDKAAIKIDKEKNGIDKSGFEIEKKIYTKLLCEAKECSKYVKDGNKNALNAVKIGATVISLIPFPGTQAAPLIINTAATGVSLGAEITDQIIDYNVANEKLRLMQGGTLTGGFGDEYNNALAAKIASIKNNEAALDKLVAGIIASIAQEALQIGSAELAKYGLTEVISKALKASKPADEIMNTIIPHLDKVHGAADLPQKTIIKQLTNYLIQPGNLKLVVERGIDIPIGGIGIIQSVNEMPVFNSD